MTPTTASAVIESHLAPDWAEGAMRHDISEAFRTAPKVLPPKWLYDDRGSELFDEITKLPEYYPTEAERTLLEAHSGEIAAFTGATTVVELGSGTSDKTRTMLDAFEAHGAIERFVPLDVSESTLVDAADMLAERHPTLAVHAVVGDFTRHLPLLPRAGDRLVAFLGSTLGNFYAPQRRDFLTEMAGALDEGEWLLLGVDLMKDVDRIIDAYNDSAGVTDQFVTNVLSVMNRQLSATFDPGLFTYLPLWDPIHERVDMRLRAECEHRARIEALDLDVEFHDHEELRVEISTKFRPEKLGRELEGHGFTVEKTWTGNGDFGLLLCRRGATATSLR